MQPFDIGLLAHHLRSIQMSEKTATPNPQDALQKEIHALLEQLAAKIRAEVEQRITQQIYGEVLGAVTRASHQHGQGAPTTIIPPAPSSTLPSPVSPRPSTNPPAALRSPTIMPPEPGVGTRPPPSSRRSRADLEALAKSLVTVVKRHREGIRAEELALEMGRSTAELEAPMRMALQVGWLRKKGNRRGTRYFTR